MAEKKQAEVADEPVDEAAAVEAQQDEEVAAAAQRDKEAAKAATKHEAAPNQRDSGGKTEYSVQRLIDNAEDFLGFPSHAVAGAMYGQPHEYLTIAEARTIVKDWLKSPVTSGSEG